MRVLVTGTSGHVGGAIARHLARAGWVVFGLSRGPNLIDELAGHVQCDMGSAQAAGEIHERIGPCAAIVHAAAALDKSIDSPAIALTNCLGTQQMVRLANLWDDTQLMFISGVTVIGRPRDLPVTEGHPTDPPTAYHASKLFGEHLTRLAGASGLAATTLRLTSPVGPGMPANRILSVFVRRALEGKPLELAGRGTRRQDYVDVRDLATAVETCLSQRISGLFNIASGVSTSNRELAETCIRKLGSSSPIVHSGADDAEEGVNWEISIAEARRRFGYQPRYSLEEAIQAVAHDHANRTHQ